MYKSLPAWVALAAAVLALTGAPVAHAELSGTVATADALRALGVTGSTGPVIVFALPSPVGPGTTVNQDGAGAGQRTRVRYSGFVPHVLVRLSRRGIGHRAWLFWEDLDPYAEFSHPSVLLLLDARRGRVLLRRSLSWEPLVDGRLPAFLRSAGAYSDPVYRAFAAGIGAASAAAARAGPGTFAAQAPGTGNLGAGLQAAFNWASANPAFSFANANPMIRAASGRTYLNRCSYVVNVVNEPYPDFPSWTGLGSWQAQGSDGSPPQSGGRYISFSCGGSSDVSGDCMVIVYDGRDPLFSPDVNAMVGLTRTLNIRAYRTTSVAGLDRALTALQAKQPPCAAITIAILAHGYAQPGLGENAAEWPTAAVALPGRSLSLFGHTWDDTEVLDATALARVLASHPGPAYNLLVWSCFSGRWTGAASGAGGTVVTSSRSYQLSYFGGFGAPTSFVQGMIGGLQAWKASPGGFVTITALPAPGNDFDRWSSPQGLCSGSALTCTFSMDPSRPSGEIDLYFQPRVFQLTVTNTNAGGVVTCCSTGRNDVVGIDCGVQQNGSEQLNYDTCDSPVRAPQAPGDLVTLQLSAVAAPGVGTWGIQNVDGCDQLFLNNAPIPGGPGTYHPTGDCQFAMTDDRNVSVTWVQVSTQTG